MLWTPIIVLVLGGVVVLASARRKALYLTALAAAVAAALTAAPAGAIAVADESTPEGEGLATVAADAPDTPVELTAYDAQVKAVTTGQRVEVLSGREESSRLFALPNGDWERELESAVGRILVKGDGSKLDDWAEVDYGLEVAPDGLVRPAASPAEFWLSPGSPSGGVLIHQSLADGDVSVDLTWDGAIPAPIIDGSRAIYVNVLQDVDLVVDSLPSGYEQYFVVRSSAAVSKIDTLTYTLDVRGADVASTDDGGYSLITANGVEVAHVPTAFAWDAAEDSRQSHPVLQPWNSENNLGPGFDVSIAGLTDAQEAAIEEATRGLVSPVTIPVSLSLKTTGRRTTVSLDVDSAWAASPDRVLPLIIDPTIGDAYETWYDTSVNAGTGNRNSSYTSDTYLRIGWDGGANMYRSYINFQTDDVDEKDIKTASLELYNYHSWSCTDEPWQVWEVDNQPSDLTWNSQPDEMTFIAEFDETRGYDQNACPDGYISADSDAVTAMVRGWAESSDTKRGVMVKATDESDYFAWKRFYSRDYYDSTRRPKITFTYNKAPATPSDLLIKANALRWARHTKSARLW